MKKLPRSFATNPRSLRFFAWSLLLAAGGCSNQLADVDDGTQNSGQTSDGQESQDQNGNTEDNGQDDDDDGGNSEGDDDDDGASTEGDDDDDDDDDDALTYYKDAKAVIDAKCATCHSAGNIGPFPLTTYDEVYGVRAVVRNSVETGTMPPWSPAMGCQEFEGNRSLSGQQKETILQWIDEGAKKGNPQDFVPSDDDVPEVDYNMELAMPEPYTPIKGPDDYRCFLLDWPGDKTQYMTAFMVEPGRRDMLHHLLVYKVSASEATTYKFLDAAESGPGYECLAGPSSFTHPNAVELIGEWVPGQVEGGLPRDIGLRFEPGDLIIAQHHYNTAFVGEQSDQSKYKMRFVDEVARPAVGSVFFDDAWLAPGGMSIPAGEKDVMHEWKVPIKDSIGKMAGKIDAAATDTLALQVIGPHMHQLGSSAKVQIIRSSGDSECVIDMPTWDFAWQGGFTLSQEIVVQPDDILHLQCHWDNSQENQPLDPDGKQYTPQDTQWGEGTRDEMCLVGLLFSRAQK